MPVKAFDAFSNIRHWYTECSGGTASLAGDFQACSSQSGARSALLGNAAFS